MQGGIKLTEPMMTINEVAEMLGVSSKTIYRLKSKPDGIRAYKVGGCVRFKRSEVEDYIQSQVVKTVVKAEPFVRGHFHYVPGMRVV